MWPHMIFCFSVTVFRSFESECLEAGYAPLPLSLPHALYLSPAKSVHVSNFPGLLSLHSKYVSIKRTKVPFPKLFILVIASFLPLNSSFWKEKGDNNNSILLLCIFAWLESHSYPVTDTTSTLHTRKQTQGS